MSEPTHPEVAVLNAALELREPERSAYLDEACAGDAALRQCVEELLQAHEQAENFLEAPSAGRDFRPSMRLNIPLTEKPGDRIGRYKLLQQIGEGGCGVVYMAEQEEPVRRRVALKVIKLGMDTKSVIARFEAERQALALMEHVNIAKVLDAGATEAGRPYFVMELVRGIKITEFCDENNVSTEERLKLFIQVCQAIQHAHQKGIIHRDIKPSNILVTVNDGVPVPKVIDFGIAKATQGRLTDHTFFTAFKQFIGTPAYMSPEQAVMTSLDIDTRSDIYSLGVLLYELLTGKTPFDQKELLVAGLDAMRRMIRDEEPPKPSTRLSTMLEAERTVTARHRQTESRKLIQLMRGDLDWIVMKCLEKDRTRRYETANGLGADILRHLAYEPVLACPPNLLYQFQKLARRNRGVLFAASVLTSAVLLALIVLAVSNVRITREKNQKADALASAWASEQHAKDELFNALRSQAQARRFSRRIGQRLDSLAALAEAAHIHPEAGLRDDAIAAMALPDINVGLIWAGYPAGSMAVNYDRLYQRYARLDEAGMISIRSLPDDQELQRVNVGPIPPEKFQGMFFSPDGKILATGDAHDWLRVWRMADGEPVLKAVLERCYGIAFSPDGRQLAVGQENASGMGLAREHWIVLIDLSTGRESRRWQTPGRVYSLAFDPLDGKLAAGYFDAKAVSIYDPRTGTLLAELPVGASAREVVAWHPDGNQLAVAGYDPKVQVWDVAAKRKRLTLEGRDPAVTELSFHPDGTLLATLDWGGVAKVWDAASGHLLLQQPMIGVIQFSADGRWLGAASLPGRQLQLWAIVVSHEYRCFGNSEAPYQEGEISPDGKLMVMGAADGSRIWELATGRELAYLPVGDTCSAFFTSDGKTLLTCGPESGLQCRPIRGSDPSEGRLQLDPPLQIQLPFAPTRACRSRDDQTLAVVSEQAGEAAVLDLASGLLKWPVVSHSNACYVALSPDAKWLATSGWHSPVARLWDAQTGQLAHEFDCGCSMVSFTPDSRRLVISQGDGYNIYELDPLRPGKFVGSKMALYPTRVAYSADGKLMTLCLATGVIGLTDVATGRTVARLEAPPGEGAAPIAFSPDGTQLVVAQSHVLHVWALRAIRAQLKPMGLDWDWPEFP